MTTLAADAVSTLAKDDKIPRPELGETHGIVGGAISNHTKNLLARSNAIAGATNLTPHLIKKMRRHHQIISGLIVQSLPLVRAEWSIECDDDDVREELTAWYRTISFNVHRGMTRALPNGYAPHEVVWDVRPDLGGRIYPTEIRELPAETCKPLVDELGDFAGFTQQHAGKTHDFDPLYALWITEGREEGDYYGRSILTGALEPWQDYAAFRAFHGRMLERFGEPVVIARAPAGKTIVNKAEIERIVAENAAAGRVSTDPDYVTPPAPVLVDNLDAALEVGTNLRHHSAIALPSGLLTAGDGKSVGYAWQLEFLEASAGHGEDFLSALAAVDKRIGRAMFVPDLLTTNGDGDGSVANALGQTHKSVWTESVEGRLDDYSRQITDQLVTPARVLNFPSAPPARLVFSPIVDEERDRLWELVVAMAEKGELPIEGRELAERYDLPLLDEAEENRRRQEAADAAAKAAEDAADKAAEAVEEDLRRRGVPVELAGAGRALTFAVDDPTAGLPAWKVPQSYAPRGPWARELTNREKRVGFAKLEQGLDDAETTALAGLDDVLDREHERVLRQLSGIVRKGTPAEVLAALSTIEIKAGPDMVRAWSELMGVVGQSAVEQLRGELAAYAEQIKPIGPEGKALFKAYATTSAERVVSQLVTETRLQLLNAYTSGVSRAGMAAIVGQTFDAWMGSEGKPVRLTTRMLSAKALNHSRAEVVERGGIPLKGAQYSALLDRVTCEMCADLDELVIAIEHTDLSRFTPPVHHSCRCLWVWITADEEDFTPTWVTPAKTKVDRFGGLVLG